LSDTLSSLLIILQPSRSPLFPYTTLFRSHDLGMSIDGGNVDGGRRVGGTPRGEVPETLSVEPTVFLYDAYPGGIGFSEPLFGLQDRKSTRLNSSHVKISYAVFCLKKKRK